MKLIRRLMNLFGNIVWFVLIGFSLGILWLLLGILWCITIVGIPFGVQCFKFARLAFFPYGKHVEVHPGKHPIANIIWAVFFGWELALGYFIVSLIFFITIVGIPKGIVALKLAKLAFLPFGAQVATK